MSSLISYHGMVSNHNQSKKRPCLFKHAEKYKKMLKRKGERICSWYESVGFVENSAKMNEQTSVKEEVDPTPVPKTEDTVWNQIHWEKLSQLIWTTHLSWSGHEYRLLSCGLAIVNFLVPGNATELDMPTWNFKTTWITKAIKLPIHEVLVSVHDLNSFEHFVRIKLRLKL